MSGWPPVSCCCSTSPKVSVWLFPSSFCRLPPGICIGRFSGSGLTTRLLARYPRLDGLLESQEGHYLFLSFFLRVIYLLPGDIVSMYFGSVRGPYLTCLLGGLLGGLPSLLAATLLGASVSQPGSPAFWLALGITAGVSVFSLLGYLLWQKRQKNKI